MKSESFFRHPIGMALSAVFATFLWGSAFPVIKISYEYLDIRPNEIGEQILFAGYRFFLSAIMIFIFYMLLGRKKEFVFQKKSIPSIMAIGILVTFGQYLFFYIGLSGATGIQGSIISGTGSFFQIILAHLLLKNDSLSMTKVIGLVIGFLGVVVTYIPKGDVSFVVGYGEWFILIATIVAAYGNIVTKKALQHHSVNYLTGYGMLFGSSMLLILGFILTDFTFFTFNVKELAMLCYLSFLSAAGFLIWNNLMKYHGVGKVSLFMFLVPVFGVMLSGIFLNEAVGITALLGLVLVAAGIIVVNRGKTSNFEESKESA